ncbi:hypothetical protein CDEST_09251 [Colletotrichum destructivum]|uniref:Uncharacterized protein n=1 Tax=Colletotrichum destructivum TaxID=34406 RepID=A0AAX4ILI2_9PEZI|nr:hypothetical protein CDEST_09251 [Colletotrichum destructivum]
MATPSVDYASMWRRELYLKVYTHDVESNTNAYWEFECQQMFPTHRGFLVNREYSPDDGNLKLDRVVSEMSPSGRVRKVMAGEDKRVGVSRGSIVRAEKDVEEKSLLAMDQDGTNALYCHTTRGTMFRTWIIQNPRRILEPLFGENTRGDPSQYIDIRTSFGQHQWHRLGSLVKNEPELGLGNFEFQFHLTAGPVWDERHLAMQKLLEDKLQDEMAELHNMFNAASVPQVAEPAHTMSEAQAYDEESDPDDSGQSSGNQEQPPVQASSSSTSYQVVTLRVEVGKKGTYISFTHQGRPFRTLAEDWVRAYDEVNRECFQWHSNQANTDFRAYNWPQ